MSMMMQKSTSKEMILIVFMKVHVLNIHLVNGLTDKYDSLVMNGLKIINKNIAVQYLHFAEAQIQKDTNIYSEFS